MQPEAICPQVEMPAVSCRQQGQPPSPSSQVQCLQVAPGAGGRGQGGGHWRWLLACWLEAGGRPQCWQPLPVGSGGGRQRGFGPARSLAGWLAGGGRGGHRRAGRHPSARRAPPIGAQTSCSSVLASWQAPPPAPPSPGTGGVSSTPASHGVLAQLGGRWGGGHQRVRGDHRVEEGGGRGPLPGGTSQQGAGGGRTGWASAQSGKAQQRSRPPPSTPPSTPNPPHTHHQHYHHHAVDEQVPQPGGHPTWKVISARETKPSSVSSSTTFRRASSSPGRRWRLHSRSRPWTAWRAGQAAAAAAEAPTWWVGRERQGGVGGGWEAFRAQQPGSAQSAASGIRRQQRHA